MTVLNKYKDWLCDKAGVNLEQAETSLYDLADQSRKVGTSKFLDRIRLLLKTTETDSATSVLPVRTAVHQLLAGKKAPEADDQVLNAVSYLITLRAQQFVRTLLEMNEDDFVVLHDEVFGEETVPSASGLQKIEEYVENYMVDEILQ